jgi:DNA-directed RNA polymerase specialized sigma24 family protein
MNASRQVRMDLGGIPAPRVREILELARVPIEAEITRLRRALSRCSAIDADDLRSLGQIVALEASLTHDAARGTLRTWIGTCVRWRLGEAMEDAGDLATVEVAVGLSIHTDAQEWNTGAGLSYSGPQNSAPTGTGRRGRSVPAAVAIEAAGAGSYDPTESYELADAKAWVERSLTGLTPRQKIIVMEQLGNSSLSISALAPTFGVDRKSVWQDLQLAVSRIRLRLRISEDVKEPEALCG